MEKMVKTYDLKSKKCLLIPASELAPGYILGRCEIGEVWIKASDLKLATQFRHGPFGNNVRERIRLRIQEPLSEVFPHCLQEWEDSFRRDQHPYKEIEVWVRIADVYSKLTAEFHFSLAQKKEVFQVLLRCSFGATEAEALHTVDLQFITRSEAVHAIREFCGS
jgi:hypothetical protein